MSEVKPSELFEANRKSIRAIVAAHRGLNAHLFGSVALDKWRDKVIAKRCQYE
jgi:hypothetical protein